VRTNLNTHRTHSIQPKEVAIFDRALTASEIHELFLFY